MLSFSAVVQIFMRNKTNQVENGSWGKEGFQTSPAEGQKPEEAYAQKVLTGLAVISIAKLELLRLTPLC